MSAAEQAMLPSTILTHFGMRAVSPYASKHGNDMSLAAPELVVGLELEIEKWNQEAIFGGIVFTSDGSLRSDEDGSGIEGVTRPLFSKHVPAMLDAFFTKYGVTNRNYSERCSTHVHVNAQGLTWDNLATLALLYQTVERLLFRYVGHERDAGIFCVPWHQSNMSYAIVKDMQGGGGETLRKWQKYSALNLLPLVTQGTVEFRHLHGTCDVKGTIVPWINIIGRMFNYSTSRSLQELRDVILNMNTVSNYSAWLQEVFGTHAGLLQVDGFEAELATGVIDSKLMLSEPPTPRTFSYRTNPAPRMIRPIAENWGTDAPIVEGNVGYHVIDNLRYTPPPAPVTPDAFHAALSAMTQLTEARARVIARVARGGL